MAKERAYGADAVLCILAESSYGVQAVGSYYAFDFKSTDLSSEQPLGDDQLLGRGRNAQDPYRGLITDEGSIEIPFDVQALGFWLTGLFGDPSSEAVKATGYIAFSDLPANNSTITLNGTAWTFKTSGASGAQTNIGVSVDATLTALASNLNGSADTQVAKCSYTANTTLDRLEIEFDTAGTTGNAFTLAASVTSNGTVDYANLRGGGYEHVWLSGGDAIPSYTIEIGHPALTTPIFFRHLGVVMESLTFEMGLEGPANGTVQLVAQGEETAAATVDADPTRYVLTRFSQGRGAITRSGVRLGNVTGGNLTFSNNLERVRVIREDGKIEAADPTLATCTGSMTVRFNGTTLVAEASAGTPVALEYSYSQIATGYSVTFAMPRVMLPKPKYAITGPGGVEASYDWRAALDDSTEKLLEVTMINDVASYAS